MGEAPSRDALLADVRRAVAMTHPDGADALVQEMEYLTGVDPRPRAARTQPLPARVKTWVPVEAVLNAINDAECADPRGPRLFWQAGTSQVVDAGLTLFSLRADPVSVATRSRWRAEAIRRAFHDEVPLAFRGEPGSGLHLLRRIGAATFVPGTSEESIDPAVVLSDLGGDAMIAPAGWAGGAAWYAFDEVAKSLREAFASRADVLVEALWSLATVPQPMAARADATAGDIGATPRELALQMTALLNEAERWQPDAIRRTWSASPGPGGTVEIRSAAAARP